MRPVDIEKIQHLRDVKTLDQLFNRRQVVVSFAARHPMWQSVDPIRKTILNLTFLVSDRSYDPAEIRETHEQLGEIFDLSLPSIRREIALATRDLSHALSDPPKKKLIDKPAAMIQVYADTPESKSLGIITAKNGEVYNFTDIYTQFFQKIYNSLYRKYEDSSRAENDTQEVFIKLWQRLGQIDDPNFKLSSYIFQIAANLATDQFRRDRLITFISTNQLSGVYNEQADDSLLHPSLVLQSVVDEIGLDLEKQRDIERVREVIASLPDRYRWSITLVDFDGLGLLEAGEVMETTRSAMKSLRFRAMHELRDRLEQEKGFNPPFGSQV